MGKREQIKGLFLVVFLLYAVPAFATEYTITDLGVAEEGFYATSYGEAINNFGVVAGSSRIPSNPHLHYHATLTQKDNPVQDLGALGGQKHSTAYGINDAGEIVGYTSTDNREHAFIWRNGVMIDIGASFPNHPLDNPYTHISHAKAINNTGQIVGGHRKRIDERTLVYHAFLYDRGQWIDLGALNGNHNHSSATDINESGAVVGKSSGHAFLWENGTMIDLSTLGGLESKAEAINNLGQIVGMSEVDPLNRGVYHAFLWENGSMTDLGTLGGRNSWALSINNSKHIVGSSTLIGKSKQHAFIIKKDGVMKDLNSLVDFTTSNTEWEYLTTATDINDQGQITGMGYMRYYKPDGDYTIRPRAFLLTPKNFTPLMSDFNLNGVCDSKEDLLWQEDGTPKVL